jgi:hypothetical protein
MNAPSRSSAAGGHHGFVATHCHTFLVPSHPIETSIAIIGAHKPEVNDLKGFFGLYNLACQVTIVGVGGPKCCDDEMTLDTEWSGATSNSLGLENDTAHIYISYVYTAGGVTNGDLLNGDTTRRSDWAPRI